MGDGVSFRFLHWIISPWYSLELAFEYIGWLSKKVKIIGNLPIVYEDVITLFLAGLLFFSPLIFLSIAHICYKKEKSLIKLTWIIVINFAVFISYIFMARYEVFCSAALQMSYKLTYWRVLVEMDGGYQIAYIFIKALLSVGCALVFAHKQSKDKIIRGLTEQEHREYFKAQGLEM